MANADRSSFAAGYIGSVTQVLPGPRVRSAYLEQVGRIAPQEGLTGRELELSELAEFCAREAGNSYAWWRAAAWAGKSALMASFVLRPPAGVEVVSFFVTARFAGQNDRVAFAEVILEQLAALLGQDLPPFLTEATREAHMLALLGKAASARQDIGRRLVLVVDGLDEDTGVTAGHDSYSIAALLPAAPPAGMRVIVASRPDPPIPADVPDGHPLREFSVVRHLAPSPLAQMIRADAERGLRRLLDGSSLERDLLGLVTAAGGGLNTMDLAELSGAASYDIHRHLRAVTGRMFASRLIERQRGNATEAYVLAHEELQATASEMLGPRRLDTYRDKIRAWARASKAAGWPPHTPDYLLRGYFQMIQAAGDIAGLLDCALDRDRHDRMLDVSGGDAAAFAEITAAQTITLAQPDPDLTIIARLALHRDELTDRNTHVPASLPGIWAALGRPVRAESLARSITNPAGRARALAEVAGALAAAGQAERALEIAGRAQVAARAVTDPALRARALTGVAAALAAAGQPQQASEMISEATVAARSAVDPSWQAWALSEVARTLAARHPRQAEKMINEAVAAARSVSDPDRRTQALSYAIGALAATGQYNRAEAVSRRLADPVNQAQGLASVAEALATAGDSERAAEIAGRAEAAAWAVTDPARQASVLSAVAGALAAAGKPERAAEIAGRAEAAAWAVTDPARQASVLSAVAGALAAAGKPERAAETARRAEAAARAATNLVDRVWSLSQLARALAAAGQPERASEIAGRAETTARIVTDPVDKRWALHHAAVALAAAGQHDQAGSTARSIASPSQQALALSEITEVLAAAGLHDQAVQMARWAEASAKSITDRNGLGWVLTEVVAALATARNHARAEAAARSITDCGDRTRALSCAARGLVEDGHNRRAIEMAIHAEAAAWSMVHPGDRAWALSDVAAVLAAAGQLDRAVEVADQAEAAARSANCAGGQALALAYAAGTLATVGQEARAVEVAAQAVASARSMVHPGDQAQVLGEVARAVTIAGQYGEAEAIAQSITDPILRATAMSQLAMALFTVGDGQNAKRVLALTWATERWTSPLTVAALLVPSTLATLANELY